MSDFGPFLFFAAAIGVIICIHVLTGKSDRKRIREHIESRGGQVISIEKPPLFSGRGGGRYERLYDVTYTTPSGEKFTVSCKTSMSTGVYWLREHPPGFPANEDAAGGHSMNYVSVEPSGPAEPIRCLGCGTMIPVDAVRCPQCGWSYKES